MKFSDMNKQQRVAWGMLPGTFLIVLFLVKGFANGLSVEDGVLTSAPGLLMLCIKAAAASIVLEIASRLIRKGRGEAVDTDERDTQIRARATTLSGIAFIALVFAAAFHLIPWNAWGIQAVSTATICGALICALGISTFVRNFAEVALYRWS